MSYMRQYEINERDARLERIERSGYQSKGDYLWKKHKKAYRGRVDSIASSRARREGRSLPASTLE